MTGLNYTAALNGNVSLDGFRDCQRGLLIRVGHPCPVGAVKIKNGQLQVERVDSGKSIGRLAEIEYSLNEPKCFDGDGEPERITQWPGVTDYPYLLRKNQGCISKEGNFSESELIDVSSERAVYEGNKVYDYFKRALPLYDTFINYPQNKMNLYAYYTPGFDFTACGDFPLPTLYSTLQSYQRSWLSLDLYTASYAIMITADIATLLLSRLLAELSIKSSLNLLVVGISLLLSLGATIWSQGNIDLFRLSSMSGKRKLMESCWLDPAIGRVLYTKMEKEIDGAAFYVLVKWVITFASSALLFLVLRALYLRYFSKQGNHNEVNLDIHHAGYQYQDRSQKPHHEPMEMQNKYQNNKLQFNDPLRENDPNVSDLTALYNEDVSISLNVDSAAKPRGKVNERPVSVVQEEEDDL